MKKIILCLLAVASLSVTTPVISHASSINGYWHNSDLKVYISGNHATANGYYAKIKKTGYNKWVSIYNKKNPG
ncbi:hypothetical protein [Lactobacillus sp. Sy-1]|uniref:hypothetical protein n=1 Tax=Lactobacillus sp. Sy-1 TaxID=2109645 RepID=UPI001C5993B0|nr:hypothetical protein [Lactobacillus sp. Sy-1]MBW1605009.1 hypothetical protein [Lactobacillus sp. Sy-1]